MSIQLELPESEVRAVPEPATPTFDQEQPLTVIRPAEGWQLVNVRELWQFRELIYFLTWRDVKVRYKQTALGAAWAILQPVMMMVIFTIFFSRMAGLGTGNDQIPYSLFAYAGLLPWTFFATAITQASNSVVGSERLITKIYFPRLSIPFAAVAAAVVDFAIALTLLIVLMLWNGIMPGLGMLLAIAIFGMIALGALGVGTLLAALNVSYRDFRYVVPFLVQMWMFATPSVYMQTSDAAAQRTDQTAVTVSTGPQNSSPEATPNPPSKTGLSPIIKTALALNPMTGLIAGFRAAALGGSLPWGQMALSSGMVLGLFLLGCLYYRKVEAGFADVI